jgi:hypothetical protein
LLLFLYEIELKNGFLGKHSSDFPMNQTNV